MRQLLLLLLLCPLATTLWAQDRIVKCDNTQIEARVLEITLKEVSYKRYSNPEGPTYRLPVEQIRYIEYPNGERDTFTSAPEPEKEAPTVAATTATSATPTPTPTQEEYLLKRYSIGDYYEKGAVKGVVLEVTPDGQHGLLISLDEVATHWDTFEKGAYRLTGVDDKQDGRKNMEAMARYIAEQGLSWEDFPAFHWCREQGEGWYLPAIDELLTIAFHFNGQTRAVYNRQPRQRVNNALKEHGGKRLDRLYYYYSSTELDDKMVQTAHMDVKPPYLEPMKKHGMTVLVRAVYRF